MKIAIDCRMSGKSGIGRYLDGILPHMLNTAKDNTNSFLLIGNENQLEKYKNIQNVEILKCDINPFSIKDLFLFPHSISKKINECDVYHSPYCNIPSGIKIPICTTIHDLVFLDVKLASALGTYIRRVIYNYAIFRSEKIFTVSKFSKQRIEHHFNCKKPIVIGYNAITDSMKNIEIDNTKRESVNQIILYVGNIKKHKGLQTLLPAFMLAKRRGLNARLMIVGDASNFRTHDSVFLDSLLDAQRTGDIQFSGKVTDKELYNLYQRASLLVQPSLYEGFGIPPLEALHFGTHVLISDIPVFREIYAKFPVSYFHAGDKEDLAAKLIPALQQAKDSLPELPKIYDFGKTAEIILNELSSLVS